MSQTFSLELEGLTAPDGSPLFGRATSDGYLYGTTYYRVSAIVDTLAGASLAVAALRAAVAKRFPEWREIDTATGPREPRLEAFAWGSGCHVRVILDYASEGSP